ncbi:hypothetical protein KIN20_011382, partial [Parelaphostrongylus tenuis]
MHTSRGIPLECATVRQLYSPAAVRRDIDFFSFVHKHAIPVFETEEIKQVNRTVSLPILQRELEVDSNTTFMRSPSTYNDGTPRIVFSDDDEELN